MVDFYPITGRAVGMIGRLGRECERGVLVRRFETLRAMVVALVLAVALLCGCTTSGPAGEDAATGEDVAAGEGASSVQKISADEAHDMMTSNEVTVLDVRTPEEFAEKHIVNAQLLTLDTVSAETAAAVAPDKDAPVLVYCRTGVRSAEAAAQLAALGYTAVYDFGGITTWPYATVEGDAETVQSGLSADQLPVGVKVVCGKTKSLPESD